MLLYVCITDTRNLSCSFVVCHEWQQKWSSGETLAAWVNVRQDNDNNLNESKLPAPNVPRAHGTVSMLQSAWMSFHLRRGLSPWGNTWQNTAEHLYTMCVIYVKQQAAVIQHEVSAAALCPPVGVQQTYCLRNSHRCSSDSHCGDSQFILMQSGANRRAFNTV